MNGAIKIILALSILISAIGILGFLYWVGEQTLEQQLDLGTTTDMDLQSNKNGTDYELRFSEGVGVQHP